MTDFEKAIHSVALKFIQTTLSYFNFGPSFCNWITIFSILIFVLCPRQTFYQFFFRLGRGCRQGYLISPYLFLSCVKILTIRIKKNENITGFKFINTQYYLSQFAD